MLIYLQAIETEEDKSKFERLYEAYSGLMFHTAFKLLAQREDAEDAVHHAFVKIAENITKISDPECPKTRAFVVTIVENCAIDLLRSRKRRGEVPLDLDGDGIPVTAEETDDRLTALILALPARQREVILLKYYHGFRLREIASLLNVSLAAATKAEQRARQRLAELYEREEENG